MNIHYRTCADAARGEEIVQNRYMALSRMRDPHCIYPQPVQHLLPRFSDGHRIGKGRAVGGEPNESQKAVPGQSDARSAVDLFGEPSMRACMLVHCSDMRIQRSEERRVGKECR